MTLLVERPCAPQSDMESPEFDRWIDPDGRLVAQFHRVPAGFLVRFPGQVDFVIAADMATVEAVPADEDWREASRSLFHNSIRPLVANYSGGLCLHGSAVSLATGAIAFLGDSGRGKTTLAGAFARAGHPFLTEDTVVLEPAGTGYTLRPTRAVLRLYGDSAAHLLGSAAEGGDEAKREVSVSARLPFADQPQALQVIYLLGPGTAPSVTIEPLAGPAALAEVMRHAFILDVEDKSRLRGHFQRLAALTETVRCFGLDFPRSYAQLPAVIEAILQQHPQRNR